MLRSKVGGVAVIVHDAEAPSDAEWASWVSDFRVIAGKLKGILIYSQGGGPNGPQRSQLTALFEELEATPPTAIVTSSVAMRGIVTAIRWFLPATNRVRSYAPADMDRALADLGVPREGRAEVTREVHAHLKTLESYATAQRTG
jgi:hypothetical protein